jgi:hypothetical protein
VLAVSVAFSSFQQRGPERGQSLAGFAAYSKPRDLLGRRGTDSGLGELLLPNFFMFFCRLEIMVGSALMVGTVLAQVTTRQLEERLAEGESIKLGDVRLTSVKVSVFFVLLCVLAFVLKVFL